MNSITHGIGLLLSLVAVAVLVTMTCRNGSVRHVVTVGIYGASLVVLYLASTLCHACGNTRASRALDIFDHIAIYVLIAGTYTPFLLVLVGGAWGWSLFGVLWGLTAAGAAFKILFSTTRFRFLSTLIYVAMGWIAVIGIEPFLSSLPDGALGWLLAGGLAYTGGVVFFCWHRLLFNHAIWHVFVLAGSTCHFLAVLWYVVPG